MADGNKSFFQKCSIIIKYIQENAAAFTLLATVAITAGSVLLKYVYYLIELGYTNYYNISSSNIDIADDNILYGIVANGIMSLFFIFISSLPYFVWQSKIKKWIKIVVISIITLVPEISLTISLITLAKQGIVYSPKQYVTYVILGIFVGLTVFSLGFLLLINKGLSKKKKTKKNVQNKSLLEVVKSIATVLVVLIVVESVLLYSWGYYQASYQNEFKVIESTRYDSICDTYVILYETDDSYFISKCAIIDQKIFINKDEHKKILKENVEYSVKKLIQIEE
jgi:hypothetical protein